jgi:hypothetical protein
VSRGKQRKGKEWKEKRGGRVHPAVTVAVAADQSDMT